VEPWAEPVNGAELLDAIKRELERFVVFPKWGAVTFTLWIVHTYAWMLRDVTTYMGIESPEKECGKSTLLMVLSKFVNRPALSSNISASAVFRVITELAPTLLIDEADTSLRGRDEFTGILNAGYTRDTAYVWRMSYDLAAGGGESEEGAGGSEGVTPAGHVERYSTWCPKGIATIGRLEPTLASRCIVFRMHRKTEAEVCERLKRLDATELTRKCARFVADHTEEIAKGEPAIPEGLTNRAADIWEPLLVLADLAGGSWPAAAREAAIGATTRAEEHSPIGSLLLDIFMAFSLAKADRLFTRDLVAALGVGEERPWWQLTRGRPVTEMWLSAQLRPYGIRPRTVRIGEQTAKGYVEEDFKETYRRYIPKAEKEAFRAQLMESVEEARAEKAEGEGRVQADHGPSSINHTP